MFHQLLPKTRVTSKEIVLLETLREVCVKMFLKFVTCVAHDIPCALTYLW